MTTSTAHLRIARPTDDIQALLSFYCNGLGFKLVERFKNHNGFDGVMLTPPSFASDSAPGTDADASAGYHLEFTTKMGHIAGKAPTQDNLLVFYLPVSSVYRAATLRMRQNGFDPVVSFNPYWTKFGETFEDADGYRVVLANMSAPLGLSVS
ncbi:hypothetical protein E4U21_007476 [Claviceps maximensis]|nr:hypothetical protein E4U21_007476 [Claviceps maximensis]